MMTIVSDLGFWTGDGWSADRGAAKEYATGAEAIAAATEIWQQTGIYAVPVWSSR